jgi:glutamine phosphoribosylpyrophosphate amidotransferase
MCGIIGFITREKTIGQIEFLYKLAVQSKIRGLHSFGLAFFDKEMITKKTRTLPGLDFFEDFLNSGSLSLIYHNRYSTSGDYQDMENNQPITIGDISVAVNGNISMKEKGEFEKEFGVRCITANDSEILLHKIESKEVLELLRYEGVTLAAVYLRRGCLYAVRNDKRPLYKFNYLNATYVCSTQDIAMRAGFKNGLFPIKPFEIFEVNV